MHRPAYVFLLLTTLFWGGNAIAGKLAVGHISPLLLNASRWTIAFAILAWMGRRQVAADWAAIRPKLGLLAMLGILGFTIFNIALYTALVHTSAINASIEQAGMPMLIFMLNFLLFGVRARAAQFVGFVMSIAGVALTASHGDPAQLLHLALNVGDALMLVAVVVYSIYTVALRYKPPVHWLSLMVVLTGSATLSSVPFAIGEFAWGGGIAPDARGWAIIAYTAIFPSILAQIFYIRGVELIGANRAGLFINLVPVFGTVLSIMLLGEDFHAYHALALALTLGGIALAEWSGRRAAALAVPPS
ncbi:MAG: DMT family transporter [Rhizobiaceae bacterium]